jgi:hypothetical protein
MLQAAYWLITTPHDLTTGQTSLTIPGIWVADAVNPGWVPLRDIAIGKSMARSLMQPQSLAMQLLLADMYQTLVEYSIRGVPTDCGPNWTAEVIDVARATGLHVSALTPENIELVWDKVAYQVEAGFVRMVPEDELFAHGYPPT